LLFASDLRMVMPAGAPVDVETLVDLAYLLRSLRRRQARLHGAPPLTYREMAVKVGCSHVTISDYFSAKILPPVDRFDALVCLLGATPAEQGALATARDRIEDRRRAEPSAPAPRWSVPGQLPRAVRGFVGRAAERLVLDSLVGTAGDPAGSIVTITGSAGVGKTALAVHWAHLVADRFPDGQLHVNLRGFDPSASPMTPDDAVRGFLDALDIPAQRVPVDLAAQAALYRSLLAGKRVLVVLDNARDAEQVRPLLPGAPGCLIVVTSRSQLPGLIAAEGAHPLVLDLLTPAEARQLLSRRLGPERVDAEPQAVEAIITWCARLPLALTIVAARAATHPQFPLAALAEELRQVSGGLDAFTDAEPATDIRAVFSWSYHTLSAPAARLFRLLSLHPGPDVTAPAAASLAGVPTTQERRLLAELTRAHLVEEHTPGRYTFHDLLRAYATELANTHDNDTDRRAALTRLFDLYLATAAAAMDTLHPAETHRRPRIPPPATPIPVLADPDTALAWLDTERPTLVAVAAHTANHDWPTHTTRLATTLNRYLDGGHYTDALAVHTHALHAAQHTGDPAGQADALNSLGATHGQLGRFGPAAEHFQRALTLFGRAGDPVGQARALGNLGIIEQRLGRYREAADHHEQALALFQQAGDRTGEARALTNLGEVEAWLGRNRPAADHHEHALALFRQAGDRTGEAHALNSLGDVEAQLGRNQPAADHLHQALALFQQFGDRAGEAWTLDSLGTLHTCLGQPAQAAEHHRQALAIFRETGDRDGEAYALNGLGEAALAADRPADVRTHHTAALNIAADIGDRHQQARAHTGLGHAHRTLDDPTHAREHYQHALALYTDLGMPDADQIRTHLTTTDSNSHELR
jgi:tetratricopeptide (TPR) repeat protein